jgi:Holliday junction resolvase RusA-like endonuclease
MYDPDKTAAFKKQLRLLIQSKYREPPLEGPLEVEWWFFRPVQQSLSKIEHQRRVSGEHLPTVKPDLSNYVKSAEDALNGVLWGDDAYITDEHMHKRYADSPGILLKVRRASHGAREKSGDSAGLV